MAIHKVIDVQAVADAVDPGRNTRPRVEYVFGGGKVKKKRAPTPPGQTYKWLDDE